VSLKLVMLLKINALLSLSRVVDNRPMSRIWLAICCFGSPRTYAQGQFEPKCPAREVEPSST
jgi:hypothetical protein